MEGPGPAPTGADPPSVAVQGQQEEQWARSTSGIDARSGGDGNSPQSLLFPQPKHGPRVSFRNTSDSLSPSFPGPNSAKMAPKGAHLA